MKKRRIFSLLALTLVLVLSFSSISVFAADPKTPEEYLWYAVQSGGFAKDKQNATTKNAVVSETKTYKKDNGGTCSWKDLVGAIDNTSAAMTLTEANVSAFKSLTNSEQNNFMGDVFTILENEVSYAVENNKTAADAGNLDEVLPNSKNAESIRSQLASNYGVGTATVSAIMHNINPDFMKANKIAGPFLDVLNVILGIVGILLMAFFFLTMLLDLSYIALPMFRGMLHKDGGQGGSKEGGITSKLGSFVSDEAVKAVEAGEGKGGQGEGQNAVLFYIKKKSVSLIFFMILLVALVSGRMMSLASSVVNLVAGFFD